MSNQWWIEMRSGGPFTADEVTVREGGVLVTGIKDDEGFVTPTGFYSQGYWLSAEKARDGE